MRLHHGGDANVAVLRDLLGASARKRRGHLARVRLASRRLREACGELIDPLRSQRLEPLDRDRGGGAPIPAAGYSAHARTEEPAPCDHDLDEGEAAPRSHRSTLLSEVTIGVPLRSKRTSSFTRSFFNPFGITASASTW